MQLGTGSRRGPRNLEAKADARISFCMFYLLCVCTPVDGCRLRFPPFRANVAAVALYGWSPARAGRRYSARKPSV